jgi:hypothetical protein
MVAGSLGRKSMLALAACGGGVAGLACLLCALDDSAACNTLSPSCVAGCVGSAIFVLYSAGLASLFFWLVYRTYKGEIDLLSAIAAHKPDGGVSLSKLQIFLWTIVLVFAWLYQLALEPGKFPELPSQALVLLGLSGATYLGVKQIDSKREVEKAAAVPETRPPTGEDDPERDV